MKRNYIFTLLLVFAGAFCACEDHRDDNMLDPQVYLTQNGETDITIYDVETSVDYALTAYCSSLEAQTPKVNLTVDANVMDAYNAANGTSYEVLSAEYYSITPASAKIDKKGRIYTFKVTFNAELMAQHKEDVRNCVLPVALSTDGSVGINAELSTNIMKPVIVDAVALASKSGLEEQPVETSPNQIDIYYPVYTDFENNWNCDLEIVTGAEAITAYNTAHHTNLRALPASAYTVEAAPSLTPGVNMVIAHISINKSAIPVDDIYSVGFYLKGTSLFGVDPSTNIYVVRLSQEVSGLTAVNRSNWTLANNASFQKTASHPSMMIDGDLATKWEAAYNTTSGLGTDMWLCPFTIIWDMNASHTLNGVELTRRTDKYYGDLKAGYIEVSADNVSWYHVADFDYTAYPQAQSVFPHYFESIQARYIKIVVTESGRHGDTSDPSSIVEFNAFAH